nr:hypothetical protein [Tanacetum cinerariifolium]
MHLQALVDRKKVIITEATIQEALRLDDAESMDCLPNEEIFTELSRMRYEKPSTKLTFYKAFFSPQWKFRIHTILQCMSAKRTSWNEFSSSMASAVICLSTGMIVAQQAADIADEGAAGVDKLERRNKLKGSKLRRLKKVGTTQRVHTSEDTVMDDVSKQGEIIANIDVDKDVTLKDVAAVEKTAESEKDSDVQGRQAESQAQIYQIDLEYADRVLSMQDDELEPIELKEVVEVVTTAKLMTEVVTAAVATITATDTPIPAAVITTAPSAPRRRKRVVIRDPEEAATPSIIIHSKSKSKDKGKGIMVEEPKPLKKQAHIKQDEAYAREKPQTEAQARKNMMIYLRNMVGFKMDYFKGMSYDDIHPIFEKYFNSNVAFLEKTKEQMEEEDSKALKRVSESQAEKAAKKQKLDEEATPLALKIPVVDYAIHTKNNKPYFKIIRADGTHQLFLSFLSLLRNFDKKELEVLWQLVKERFASSKPKNFFDDFLLTTLTYMFEKPDVQAQVWKNQKSVHGLEKKRKEGGDQGAGKVFGCFLGNVIEVLKVLGCLKEGQNRVVNGRLCELVNFRDVA